MENLESIKKFIGSVENLKNIVLTMKNYATYNINQFYQALEGSEKYKENLDRAFYILFLEEENRGKFEKKIFEKEGEVLHIILGSDHGLVGKFNERIIKFYDEQKFLKKTKIILMGEQLRPLLSHREIYSTLQIPQSPEAINNRVQEILYIIEELGGGEKIEKVEIFYTKMEKGGSTLEREMVFPLDFKEISLRKKKWKGRSIPGNFEKTPLLLENTIKNYLLITLYRAFCNSLMSENSSRLYTMKNAEKNIDLKLEELDFAYKTQRQTEITEEILDIISGFRSIKDHMS